MRTATPQPAYVTLGTLNDAPTASRRSAASAPSVTSRPRAVSTPAPYLISSSGTASRVAARLRASDRSLAAALYGGGVGVPHVEAPGGKTKRVADDLGQHGLEARAHRSRAGVHGDAAVG